MPVTTRISQAALLFLILSVPIKVSSQQAPAPDPYILVNSLNDNSGLPQNSIITQYIDTSSGMLWLATFGGLVRYNGISVKSFDNHQHDSLLTNKLVNMFRTWNGEVYASNIHSQLLKIGPQDITINQSLTWIWQQYNIYIWFRGVLNSTNQIQRLGINAFGRQPWYPGQQNWMAGNYDCYITAISNNRFAVLSKKDELLIYADSLLQFRLPLPFKTDSARLFFSKGLLYVLDNQLNGVCYDVSGKQPEPVPAAFDRLKLLRGKLKGNMQLYYNELNDQAVISAGSVLIVLGADAGGLFPAHQLKINELPRSISGILYYPRRRTLFIGTTTEGLYVYRQNYFQNLVAPDLALNINSTYAKILRDSTHLLTSRGVTYDLTNNSAAYAKELNSMASPFSRDSAGGYYFCNDSTVQYQPASGGPPQQMYKRSDLGKKDNAVRFVWFDAGTKRLWIMETYQWGYFQKGRYFVSVHSRSKLPVASYYARKDKEVYLATEQGLVILRDTGSRWTYVTGTRNMETRFVAADPKLPVCWFSTYGYGFGAYLPEKGKVIFFPQDSGKYLSTTHALIEDDRQNFWMPTNKGLFRTRKSQLINFIEAPSSGNTLYYDYFDRQDGLITNEFNGGAQPIYTWWNNELLLSTINGVLRFDPDEIQDNGQTEPLFADYAQSRYRKYIKPPAEGQPWEFNKEERVVSWAFNKACWGNPYSLRVEYRLDHQTEWKVMEGNKLITGWERIDGGDHTLHIRQYNPAEGEFVEKKIPFSIGLYWYETWWCWLLAILVLLAGISLLTFHFSKLKRMLKVSRKKDEVLSETLSLMEEGNAMLNASNLYKSKMVYVLMHDITVPVASIEKVSGMIHRNIEKVNPDTIKTVMKEINDATRNLLILSDQLIQWSNIQDTVDSSSVEPADIHAVVEEIREELGDRFQWRNNQLINHVPEDMQMQTKVHLLHHLVFNLVLNANKNMKDGVIEVEASQTQGYTVLIVKDNANSMDTELRELLISASASHDSSAVYSGHKLWHIGYQIIFDLVQLMKGEIEIKAGSDDSGLIIAIGLPPLHDIGRK